MNILQNEKLKNFKRTSLPLPVYLAFLLLLSFLFSSVSFAKYISYSSASSAARVAYFDVAASALSSEALVLDMAGESNGTASCSFTVTSNSEVMVADKVSVTLPYPLPEDVQLNMSVNGTPKTAETDGLTYTFSENFSMKGSSHTWVLSFSCENAIDLTEESTISGIRIRVDAEQID